MKRLVYMVGVVILAGCSRNVPVPAEVFDIAKKTCSVYNSTLESVTGEQWFPTFSSNMRIVCKREGLKDKFIITFSVE